MAQLDNESIVDLITTTQKDLGKMRWTEIATDIQEHIALPNLLRKEKVQFGSGTAMQRSIMVDHSDAAKHVGLYEVDNVNVGDVMQTISVPWRHTTTNHAFERREIAMNRNPARIVELVKIRRADSMIALAEKMESTWWAVGPSASTDVITPYGVFYWIVGKSSGSSAFASTGEFGGTAPTGFSDVAGLSATTYPRWANWTHQHDLTTSGNEAQSVQHMRKAAYKTNFKSPTPHPDYARGPSRYVIYTTFTALEAFEAYAESQNDRLGKDIASMANKAKFMGNDIVAVPQLDAVDGTPYTNPIIGINWACFFPVCLRGEYLNTTRIKEAPNQHTVLKQHVDLTWNTLCDNRRRCWILID